MHIKHLHFPISFTRHHVIFVAHNHDDWKWFKIWFSVATVTASIVLNLGIFTLLVSSHMLLDIVKYRTKHHLSWHWTIVETVRESMIDVFFISLGLLLAIFFYHAVAIGGLGRMAHLQRVLLHLVLRVGPRLKIAEHMLEVFLYYKHHFAARFMPHQPLSRGEWGLLVTTLFILIAIVTTPLFTPVTWEDVQTTMGKELTPRLELGITKTLEELR